VGAGTGGLLPRRCWRGLRGLQGSHRGVSLYGSVTGLPSCMRRTSTEPITPYCAHRDFRMSRSRSPAGDRCGQLRSRDRDQCAACDAQHPPHAAQRQGPRCGPTVYCCSMRSRARACSPTRTFALLDGWWLYEDAALRLAGLSHACRWRPGTKFWTMRDSGRVFVATETAGDPGQHVIVGRKRRVVVRQLLDPPEDRQAGPDRAGIRQTAGSEDLIRAKCKA